MPIYRSPIQPYDPVVRQEGTNNFLYLRDSFYGEGQDSYTQPFSQNQEMFSKLLNIMPISQGVCCLRYGYNLFNNPGIGAVKNLYSYQNLEVGIRQLLYTSGTAVNVSNEDGTSIASLFTSVTPNPRCAVSRDYAFFNQSQTSNLAAVINPHGDCLKWRSDQGVTNMGIANGPTSPTLSGPNSPVSATDSGGGGPVWSNPGNATAADGVFATNSWNGLGANMNVLLAENFGFTIPSNGTITGIQVDVKGTAVDTLGGFPKAAGAYIIKNGTLNGGGFPIQHDVILSGVNAYFTVGGPSDLWGLAWLPGDINVSNFGVGIGSNQNVVAVTGTTNFSIDHIRITIYFIGGITIASSSASGSITLVSGRVYAASYRNSLSGHWSDISDFSVSTGALTNKQVVINVPFHGDPQVDMVAILATLDGGDTTTMYVLNSTANVPSSAGSTFQYTDNTADTILVDNNIASEIDDFGVIHGASENSVPTLGLNFFCKYRGRIYGAANTTLFFSKNLDEVTTSTGLVVGRYEEAWPILNSLDISTQRESIRGLLTDGDVLYVGTERHMWRLSGDSPSNFSKPEIVFNEVGILNQDVWTIAFAQGQPVGMLWITPDRRIIMSNFGNYQDIGTPIQDILNTLNVAAGASAWGSFFSEAAYDVYILAIPTGSNTTPDTLCVYDLRANRWLIWRTADNFTAGLFNINASGVPQWLMAAPSGKVYQFGTTFSQDRVNDTPVAIIPVIQTPWLHLGEPTKVKALNEIEIITGDSGLLTTIDGASVYAQTLSPNSVITSAALSQSVRGFNKVYLAGLTTKDRFYRFTFTGTGASQNVLEGFTIEAVPIVY